MPGSSTAPGRRSAREYRAHVRGCPEVRGLGRFLPVMVAMTGLLTLGLIPLFPKPIRALPPQTRRWLLGGGSLFALQSILLVSGIAGFGQATAANVIYSSRGLWSILAVVFLGHWFHSTESRLDASVLRWRFVGASKLSHPTTTARGRSSA